MQVFGSVPTTPETLSPAYPASPLSNHGPLRLAAPEPVGVDLPLLICSALFWPLSSLIHRLVADSNIKKYYRKAILMAFHSAFEALCYFWEQVCVQGYCSLCVRTGSSRSPSVRQLPRLRELPFEPCDHLMRWGATCICCCSEQCSV